MLTALDIKYITSSNKEIAFTDKPYLYKDYDMLDYSWRYSSSKYVDGRGIRIERFNRIEKEFKIILRVFCDSKADFEEKYYKLVDSLEKDIYSKTSGRLYVGEDYIECFCIESAKGDYVPWENFVEVKLGFLAPYGVWISEDSFSFFPGLQEAVTSSKKYSYKYSYKYSKDGKGEVIPNGYISAVPALIKIYGHAENPSFSVGNNFYKVFETVQDNEYIEIDQRNKTVYKVYNDGTRENIFHKRNKENSVFTPINPGNNLLVASGGFGIDITTYTERSEPRWI